MQRASSIRRAGEWNVDAAIDRVLLDADERRRRRVALTGVNGTQFLLDLPHATMLHHGDGLVLDDGAIVCVAGQPEPLLEITATTPHHLAWLAWHIGNRHTDVQIIDDRLRIRRDHVLRDMLIGLGARVSEIEAPFDPEQGAYGGHGQGHGHDHHHPHRHHDEGHGHGT